jgi:hypothetical protein
MLIKILEKSAKCKLKMTFHHAFLESAMRSQCSNNTKMVHLIISQKEKLDDLKVQQRSKR